MNMANARKFTFDLDLANEGAPPPPSEPEPVRTLAQDEVEAMLASAREEAYQEGLKQGAESAQTMARDSLAQGAQALAGQASDMLAAIDDHKAQAQSETTSLAFAIGRKLAGHLIARYPSGELEALIEEAMTGLEHAPHLVIRCNPELNDTLKAAAEERMATSGFSGRLVVMGDPEIGLGDGRLEWVDGGLARDVGALSRAVEERIRAYLAANSPTPSQQDT